MKTQEKVKQVVAGYLWHHLSHLTGPGKPHFDKGAQKWKVPVLCKDQREPIGEVWLDSQLNIEEVRIPQRTQKVPLP